MTVTEVRSLLTNGTMLLHKTTDAQSALLCFSLVTVLSNNVLLAYIATDQTKRSSGVGSKHMKALIDLLKNLYPTYLGVFLEIESTKEKNLSADEDKARKRRLAFYQRLHCKRMLHKEYLLPSYTPSIPARQGELLWSEFGVDLMGESVLRTVIHEIYTRAYNLSTSDPSYIKVIGQFAALTPTASTTSPSSTNPSTPSPVSPAVSSDASPTPEVAFADVADVSEASTSGTSGATGGDGQASPEPTPAVIPAPAPEPTPVPAKTIDNGSKS